ncbi:MAG: ATPase domain-containing protein [Nitrososphaerales archaeon]
MSLKDIKGIGEKTLAKLMENGISDLRDLAVAKPSDISSILGISIFRAKQMIREARDLLLSSKELEVRSGILYDAERKSRREFISTGSQKLDQILGGGICTDSTMLISGEFGSGKTQLCLTSCVNAIGKGYYVAWIETEPDSIDINRLNEIASSRNVNNVLNNFFIIPASEISDPRDQYLAYEKVIRKFDSEQLPLKVFVVDSFMAKFRSTFLGRETYTERAQELMDHIGKLQEIASKFSCAVLATTPVMGVPDMSLQLEAKVHFGIDKRPYGGDALLHSFSKVLILQHKATDKWSATLVDSSYLPRATAEFTITKAGIVDV